MAVIGAGLDLGAGRRGVDMGPSAIRYAGLDDRITELGRDCNDLGDVGTAVAEATSVVDERVRYLPQIKATCERIAELVAGAVGDGYFPLVVGGDHAQRRQRLRSGQGRPHDLVPGAGLALPRRRGGRKAT